MTPTMSRLAGLLLVTVPFLLTAGCTTDDPVDAPAAETTADGQDTTGGGPLPQQFEGESFPGERDYLEVTVRLADNGCFLGTLPSDEQRYLLVWPTGSEAAGDRVVLPDGTEVTDQDVVAGPGALSPVSALAGIEESSFWAGVVEFCDPGAEQVLALDEAVPD